MSKKTGNEKVENPAFLEQGEQAEIEFKPNQLIYLESFETCDGLGRVAVMLGKVIQVTYKDYK